MTNISKRINGGLLTGHLNFDVGTVSLFSRTLLFCKRRNTGKWSLKIEKGHVNIYFTGRDL